MRMIRRSLVAIVLGLSMVAGGMTTASAAVRVLDAYCSPSGDYCTAVVKRNGTIIFKIGAAADYFGTATACVTKETRVCRSRSPQEGAHGIYRWSIRWQGNYPREGAGIYTVRWLNEGGDRIGKALRFRRR